MPIALSVTAPLLLSAVLLVSAVGKLRAPARSRTAFSALGLPTWLDRPSVAAAHPWGEIALAALLLVVPGPAGVVVAAAALLLMLVYLVLVVRGLRSPVDVDCACFGNLGGERITAATVWRNAWLSAIAAVALWGALDGVAVLSRVGSLGASGLWWLAGVLGAILTTVLVVGAGRPAESPAPAPVMSADGEPEDYLRTRTPAVPVTLADGSTTDLRQLSAQRAQLLLYVSETCGSCADVIAAAPAWRARLPEIDIRLLLALEPAASGLRSLDEPMTAHDPERRVKESFGMTGSPAAVLLGVDGLLAGGPVSGNPSVQEFVAEVAETLEAGRAVD